MKGKKKLSGIVLMVLIGGISFLVIKAVTRQPIQKETRFLMDTYCTISVPGSPKVRGAITEALDRMAEVDQKFNMLNPKSPLYDFNNFNRPIIDKEIIGIVKVAMQACELLGGKFDITIEPVMKVWGFYGDTMRIPDSATLRKALACVGYKNLRVTDDSVTKVREEVKIDLGGIAKGYSIAEAAKVLKAQGITSALIDGGGQIYAFGGLHGKPWRIGIRDPRSDGIVGVLDGSDISTATSGDYERFFEKDGVRYHHLMDPATGYPARTFASLTVVNNDPLMADAMSKLFVVGNPGALEMTEKLGTFQIVIVGLDGKVSCSSGLKNKLHLVRKE